MSEQPVSEETLREMGLSDHEIKLFNTKIDISGGPRSQRDRHIPHFAKYLQEIDPEALYTELERQKAAIGDLNQKGDTDAAESRRNTVLVLDSLASLKVMEDKQAIYDRLSKRKVLEVAEGAMSLQGSAFFDAAFQLKKIVERNAEAEFPDELEQQLAIRRKENEDAIQAARDRAVNITVR